MIRRIIQINENQCDGCGLCATACHEGAIAMVNGKAKLLREDYCDGLGDCLPACPKNAITFIEREAPAYDEAAVLASKKGSAIHTDSAPVKLQNWPVQIKLAPIQTPGFHGADLLIAADCTAYSYSNFHKEFMEGKTVLIGCPKLDGVQYADKLSQIFSLNEIHSITVVRMTVPCCGGLPFAVNVALQNCGKSIPLNIVTISPDGNIIK